MRRPLLDPDGRVVAVLIETGVRFAHEDASCFEFSPDGARLVTAGPDGTARLWDSRTGELLRTLRGPDAAIFRARHSPDGARLVTAQSDDCVRVWDSRSGDLLHVIRCGIVHQVAYAPDGDHLAGGLGDGTVRLWCPHSGATSRILRGHTGPVLDVTYSPDGAHLASASQDHTVRIWDTRTGELLRTLVGHQSRVCGATYSPDGAHLVSASDDATLRVWDSRTGAERRVFDRANPGESRTSCGLTRVFYSPDGARLAVQASLGSTALVDPATGRTWRYLDCYGPVAWSPDGETLVTRPTESDGTPMLLRLADTGSPRTPQLRHLATRQARTVGRAAVGDTSAPWTPRLSDTRGACLGVLPHTVAATHVIRDVALAPDGRTLYTSDGDGRLHAWDLDTGVQRWTTDAHASRVGPLAIAPDGAHLATGELAPIVTIRDSATGRPRSVLEHDDSPDVLAYAPDGARLAAGSVRGVWVWDTDTGALLLARETEDCVRSLCFSPDGSRLALGTHESTVHVWDSRTGEPLLALHGHREGIDSLCFSPDGARLLSAGEFDATARVWDSRTGDALLVLEHDRGVTSARFSADGTRILTTSYEDTVQAWDATTGALLWTLDTPTIDTPIAWAASGAFVAAADVTRRCVALWDARGPLPTESIDSLAPDLRRLPALAAALHRYCGRALGLDVLRDVLRLLRHEPIGGPARALAEHPHLRALASLDWPADAVAAVALLLCADADDPEFAPPPDTTPAALCTALAHALAVGEPCRDVPAASSAWATIRDTLDDLDLPQLLALLRARGPAVCAAQPQGLLPLRACLSRRARAP